MTRFPGLLAPTLHDGGVNQDYSRSAAQPMRIARYTIKTAATANYAAMAAWMSAKMRSIVLIVGAAAIS